jgi:hypothetical protein
MIVIRYLDVTISFLVTGSVKAYLSHFAISSIVREVMGRRAAKIISRKYTVMVFPIGIKTIPKIRNIKTRVLVIGRRFSRSFSRRPDIQDDCFIRFSPVHRTP